MHQYSREFLIRSVTSILRHTNIRCALFRIVSSFQYDNDDFVGDSEVIDFSDQITFETQLEKLFSK